MHLDEGSRRRLLELSDLESHGLSDADRDRVTGSVVRLGPGVVRRARVVRRVKQGAMAGTALGVVALAVFATQSLRVGGREGAPGAPTMLAEARLACAGTAVPTGGFERTPDGKQVLDLGPRAYATASADAEVSLSRLEDCRTEIQLAAGSISVHAIDLAGGSLSVRSSKGAVHVRGTIFSVVARDELTVEVVEGKVEVEVDRGKGRMLRSGRKLRRGARTVDEEALAQPRQQQILEELGLIEEMEDAQQAAPEAGDMVGAIEKVEETRPRRAHRAKRRRLRSTRSTSKTPAVPESIVAEPGAEQLIREAHALVRAGDLRTARLRFRAAGQKDGATAEGAWVALAKLELAQSRAQAALEALDQRRKRFGEGVLGPEASWLEVQAAQRANDLLRARRVAEYLQRTWPQSEQAKAAERWLEAPR